MIAAQSLCIRKICTSERSAKLRTWNYYYTHGTIALHMPQLSHNLKEIGGARHLRLGCLALIGRCRWPSFDDVRLT